MSSQCGERREEASLSFNLPERGVLRDLNKSFYLKAIRRLCGAVSLFVPELSDRPVETVINEAVTHPLPLAHLGFFFFSSLSRPP